MNISKIKGHIAMIVANVSWGLMSPFIKNVVLRSDVNAWTIIAFRLVGAAVAFWITSLFVKKEKVPAKDLLWMAIAAMFAIVLNQGVFVFGVSYTSPINASIVTTTLPLIAMFIAAIYLKEPITWKKLLGVVFGAIGAIVIVLSSTTYENNVDGVGVKGILLCIIAEISYAVYFVFFKKFVGKYSPVTLMKWMFLFSSVVFLPLTWNQIVSVDYTSMSSFILFELLFIVLASTFLSYMMIPIAQKYLRPTVAIMYNNVQPIVASFAAVVMRIDIFGWKKVFAILLVFIGVYFVTTSKSKEDGEKQRT